MKKIISFVAGASMLLAGSLAAQTPQTSSGVPDESFLAEQFCFETQFSNSGAVGYGPYLRIELADGLTLDSVEIFGTGGTLIDAGEFPPAPDNQLDDPVIGEAVTGEPGSRLYIIKYPVGSVVDGGPDLPATLCVTIDEEAVVGEPLDVNITPVYEFGDTPTGDNGPIVGSTEQNDVTPTVILFEKTENAPESERTPGPSWPYSYTLTVDIANTATVNPLVIADELPADFQYDGSVNISGGNGCAVTEEPSTSTPGGQIEVTCLDDTVGTTDSDDVVVTYSGHLIDLLDEAICHDEPVVNQAWVQGTYQPGSGPEIVLPLHEDEAVVTARHVAVQKHVSPAQAVPGQGLTYTLDFQVTDFGDADSLVVTDVLPDGINFVGHGTLEVNGSAVTISPAVTQNPDFTTTLVYDIGAETGTLNAGTDIQLTYDARVRTDYQDSGQPVLASDSLTNHVVADYSLVQGASGCSDDSQAVVDIVPVDVSKEIVDPQPFYVPGENIVFRLTLDVPAGSTREIHFEDHFPLPVIDATQIDTTFGNDIDHGPDDTLGVPPDSITVDAAQNALRIEWDDISNSQPQTLQIDITAPINDIPFADGLFLTNIFQAHTENTAGKAVIGTGPVGFQVGAPDVFITKGVSETDGNGSIDPDPANEPVDGDISGVDAHDSITYVITAENRGTARAHEVTLTDPTPAGLTGCVIDSLTDGTGASLGYSGDLENGVLLDDPLAAGDGTAGPPFGAETALLTVSCQVEGNIAPNTEIVNTATVDWASQDGAVTFPPREDDATATSANIDQQKYYLTSSEPGTSDTDSPPRATIGEIVRYRLAVRIPEGEIADLVLEDHLPSGLSFLDDGSATATFVSASGAGLSAANVAGLPVATGTSAHPDDLDHAGVDFSLPAGAIAGGPSFTFGDVTNSNSDNEDAYLVVDFNALVNNSTAGSNTAGADRSNSFTTRSGSGALDGASNSVNIRIAEPELAIVKAAAPDTGEAGDIITFSLTVSANSGSNNSPAYEVNIADSLPDGLVGLTNVNINSTGDCSAVVDNTSGDDLDLFVEEMGPGCQVEIEFEAELEVSVEPGTVITNDAEVDWTSLPGGQGTSTNPTGSNTPGASGDDDGARDGSGSGMNDYHVGDSADVTIDSVVASKVVSDTSESATGDEEHRPNVEDLAIGESATFDITVTIPHGTTPQVVITDTVPFTNGIMRVDSASVISVGANLNADVPSPAPVISDSQLGDGIDDTVVFDFGQVVNDPAGSSSTEDSQIVVQVVATLVDDSANQNGDALTNNVLVQFGSGLDASASAPVDVVEPELVINKAGSITGGQAGDTVTYTVTIGHGNGSTADAHDLVFIDDLPPKLALDPNSIQVISGPDFDVDTSSGNSIELGWIELERGAEIVLEYQAELTIDVQPQEELVNVAKLEWDSIAGDSDDEREYSADDDHVITVTEPGVEKIVFDTSEPSTGSGQYGPEEDLTIGEEVTYRFTVTFPEGTSDGVVITDQLPTGSSTLALVSSEVISVGAQLSGAQLPSVGDPGTASDTNSDGHDDRVRWELGTIVNNPDGVLDDDDRITFEVVAVVVDEAVNQGGITDQRNVATMETSSGDPISGSVGVDIVAPELNLEKTVEDPADGRVEAGEVVTVRLDIEHTSGSSADAFNLEIEDSLPAGLNWNGNASVGGSCSGLNIDSSNDPTIIFSLDELALADGSCYITYEVVVDQAVEAGDKLTNSAALEYDSLPDGDDEHNRRRDSADAADVTIKGPGLTKSAQTSGMMSAIRTASGILALPDVSIGETVTYELTIEFPEGITTDAVLVDSLPASTSDGFMEAIGASVVATGANLSTSLPGTPVYSDTTGDGIDDTVTFDFGDVTNTIDGVSDEKDRLTVEIVALVVDHPANEDGLTLVNLAELTYGHDGHMEDDAEVHVVEPDVDLRKSMGPVSDGVVRIELTLENSGSASAYNLIVEDVFDEADWDVAQFAAVNVPAGYTLDIENDAPAAGQHTVRLASTGSQALAAGSSVTASFDMPLAVLPPDPNPISNTADLVGGDSLPPKDGSPRDESRDLPPVSDSDQLGMPDLSLTKTADLEVDADSSGDVSPGDTLRYTLTLDNIGAAPATNIVIDDSPDANTELVVGSVVTSAGTVTIGNNAGDGTVQVTIGSLAANDSVIIEYDTVINSPLPAGVESVINQATHDSDETPPGPSDDPDTPDPDDPTEVPVNAAPDLSIVKDGGDATAQPGSTLVYTLSYANNGNQDATGVEITETVPDNTTFNAAASDSGWVCADTVPGSQCILDIGDLDAGDSGTVDFAVDIDAPLPAGVSNIFNEVSIDDDGSNGPDPTPEDNEDDETTPVDAAPDLVLAKTGSGSSPAPGDTYMWTLDYENVGNIEATGVEITETVPAHTTFDSVASSPGWTCSPDDSAGSTCIIDLGSLAGGDSGSVNFAVVVDDPLASGVESIYNAAVIADDGSNGPDPTPDNNEDDDTVPVDAWSDLSIAKSDGGVTATPGDTVVYVIEFANSGNQSSTGVEIIETVPVNTTFDAANSSSGWTCTPDGSAGSVCVLTIGTLAGGETGSANFAVVVDDSLPSGVDELYNAVMIDDDGSNGPDPTPEDNEDDEVTPVDAVPDLVLTKTGTGTSPAPGDTYTWTLDYENVGNQEATGVEITETVPDHTTFDSAASSPGWSCSPDDSAGSTCVIDLGSLAGGDAGSVVFAVVIDDPLASGVESIYNAAVIADDGSNGDDPTPDNNEDNDTVPVDANIDLSIAKSDGGVTATAGGTLVYTLDYANSGNQDATGVEITETVPAHTTFDAGASSPGWACTPDDSAGSTCVLTIGTLTGGETGSADFAVVVDEPLAAGVDELHNVVTIEDDGDNGPDPTPDDNEDDETTPVDAGPDLVIIKTDGGVTAAPGDTVVYTLDYENAGSQDATGVEITETVPDHTTFDAAASDAGWTCAPDGSAGSVCTLDIGDLDAGDSGQATFAVTVDDPVDDSVTELLNTARIDDDGSNGPDLNPDDNEDDENTPVSVEPELSLDKRLTGAPDPIEVGSVLTYTIVATNTGNVTLENVVVSDPMITPTGGTTPCAAVAPGDECTLEGDYTVTQDDVDAGEIVNTATAGSDQTPDEDDTVTTPVDQTPAIELVKEAELESGETIGKAGDIIEYTLTATNVGNVTLDNVVITDDLITLTCTPAQPATLDVGESMVCMGTYEIQNSDMNKGQIVNHAEVTGESPSGETVEDSDDAAISVRPPIPVPAGTVFTWLLLLLAMGFIGLRATAARRA